MPLQPHTMARCHLHSRIHHFRQVYWEQYYSAFDLKAGALLLKLYGNVGPYSCAQADVCSAHLQTRKKLVRVLHDYIL